MSKGRGEEEGGEREGSGVSGIYKGREEGREAKRVGGIIAKGSVRPKALLKGEVRAKSNAERVRVSERERGSPKIKAEESRKERRDE